MELSDKPFKIDIVILIDEFDDYSVLFNPLTAETMGLNPVGLTIWEEIDGERSVSDISKLICNRFNVSEEISIHDTKSFIQRLYRRLFIVFSHEEFITDT